MCKKNNENDKKKMPPKAEKINNIFSKFFGQKSE